MFTVFRRLESVDNPITVPASIFRQDQKNVNPLKGSSSQVDQKLAQRLEKLKEDKGPPPPSEAELRKRLANLRSDNEYVGGPSRHVHIYNFNLILFIIMHIIRYIPTIHGLTTKRWILCWRSLLRKETSN